ncbi:MAG TPA: hypothetical protein VNT53_00210 [Pseudolysinimonas sp.]|nr:hypothetical protein [Pseudolysinimonas sp.]
MSTTTFADLVADRIAVHVDGFRDSDADAVVDGFFSPDALWECQGTPRAVGSEQLRPMFGAIMQESRIVFDVIASDGDEHVGWTFVDYHVYIGEKPTPAFTFRCQFTWRKLPQGWRATSCVGFPLDAEA